MSVAAGGGVRGALAQVASWPASDPAAGVTDATDTIAQTGAIDHRHEWASVTKLVTALCVLRLSDAGSVSLDEPAGPPGSTVRHLLAHASGLGFEGTDVLAKPGQRRVYSNAGFDLLGALASERTGLPFAECAAATVFGPLAMSHSAIEGTPSAGGVGPLADLLRLCRELLAPALVTPGTLAAATTVAFPGIDGVLPGFGRQNPNDWGLGFEIRDHKSPHWTGTANSPATFGHFGKAGSFLWVDPVAGLACAALAGVPFGAWAIEGWPKLSDEVLAQYGSYPTRPVM
ncbi:MAG TPA: serine hydrolase domain-containing protein [Acidothermaceae bacterium]